MGSQAQIMAASLLSGVLLTAITPEADAASSRHAVGWCQVAQKDLEFSLSPGLIAQDYIFKYQRNNLKFKSLDLAQFSQNAKVTLLSQPKLGTIARTEYNWQYQPAKFNKDGTYVGTDRFVMKVEYKGISIFVHYYIEVIGNDPSTYIGSDGERYAHDYCKRELWNISQSPSDSANVSAIDLAAWQRSSDLSALIANASQSLTSFTDLPSTALGETTGHGLSAQITLDTYAAGHGRFIDPTQLDPSTSSGLANSDYLPTSDASVWQAKAGSAAAGKMDMLSVLLHEYGHALGLEHSGNGADFMATSLQSGVRKLSSSEELALMGQLVAQLKAVQGAALTPALSQGERGQEPLNPFGHA